MSVLPKKYSLVVEGGTLVIPGVGLVHSDVALCGDKIAALGNDLASEADKVFDAKGKMVFPGIVDPHTHIGNEKSYEEEAESETRAAVVGGITTIGIFLRSLQDSYTLHLPAFRKAMDELSYVDSIFHPQIFTEEQIDEIPLYSKEFGIRSFKFYMSGMPGIVNSITDDVLLRGFQAVAKLGADAIACVHCETGSLIQRARAELKKKEAGTLADWELAHPGYAEALAVQTALYLAKVASAHLYVVHVSSHEGLEIVRNARRQGLQFTAETTSVFLGIASDDPNGFLAKIVPPVRTRDHQDALWQGVLEGSINTVGTDNTSRLRATKNVAGGLHGAMPGVAALGTHLPVLLHHGRLRGIPLEILVDRATRAPAMVYGIYPKKGTIAVGSDADLVVVDLDLQRVVNAEALGGMSDFSPFEGKTLRGWPIATIKAGQIVARDGQIVGKPTGRYLPRTASNVAPNVDWLNRSLSPIS